MEPNTPPDSPRKPTPIRDDLVMSWSLRAVFFACAVGIGLYTARSIDRDELQLKAMLIAAGLAGLVILVEAWSAKSSIATVSAIVFGLIIGFLAAHLFIGVISLMGDFEGAPNDPGPRALRLIRLALTLTFCFLGVTYILRTKDDLRFIVPYVEFQKRVKGPRPLVLDTSAIIDGRIVDLAAKGIFDAPLVVPRFVMEELQRVADSGDKIKRARGRRGLERLKSLQELAGVDLELSESTVPHVDAVDRKLIELTRVRDGKLVTLDFNLVKVCDVEKVAVLNLNEIAQALRPTVSPGDRLTLKLVRPGEGAGQAVGYLEDGTMVVIERARDRIGQELPVTILSQLQTSAGRMLFGRVDERRDERSERGDAGGRSPPADVERPPSPSPDAPASPSPDTAASATASEKPAPPASA